MGKTRVNFMLLMMYTGTLVQSSRLNTSTSSTSVQSKVTPFWC